MNGRRKFLGLSLIGFLSACAASGLESIDSSAINLTISAASSLQDVIQELGNLYCQQKPDIKFIYNFGSSGSLRH
ncbi:MAG: molybdate ABC transporter substrate-binding protein, partial [Cyanobacteria bacterium J06558_2]